MRVYVVTRDEDICGVFTTPNSATRMAEAIGGRWAEYELNPQLPTEAVAGKNFYRVDLARDDNNNVLEHGRLIGQVRCVDFRGIGNDHYFYGLTAPQWRCLAVHFWAKTPQEAIDYAQTLRQKLIDDGKWG